VFLNWRDMEPSEMLLSLGFCLFVMITKRRQVRAQTVIGLAPNKVRETWESSEIGLPAAYSTTEAREPLFE